MKNNFTDVKEKNVKQLGQQAVEQLSKESERRWKQKKSIEKSE